MFVCASSKRFFSNNSGSELTALVNRFVVSFSRLIARSWASPWIPYGNQNRISMKKNIEVWKHTNWDLSRLISSSDWRYRSISSCIASATFGKGLKTWTWIILINHDSTPFTFPFVVSKIDLLVLNHTNAFSLDAAHHVTQWIHQLLRIPLGSI